MLRSIRLYVFSVHAALLYPGIPFALDSSLVRIASDRDLMHLVPTRRATIAVSWLVIGVVTTLNLILIVLIAAGV